MKKLTNKYDNLTFKSLEQVSSANPSRWIGILSDDRFLIATFLAGELEIGIGIDKMDALKNREVVLSDYGDSDYLEENTLLGNMGWKK